MSPITPLAFSSTFSTIYASSPSPSSSPSPPSPFTSSAPLLSALTPTTTLATQTKQNPHFQNGYAEAINTFPYPIVITITGQDYTSTSTVELGNSYPTAFSTNLATQIESSKSGFTKPDIVGIVFGVTLSIAVLIAVLYIFWLRAKHLKRKLRKRRRRRKSKGKAIVEGEGDAGGDEAPPPPPPEPEPEG